eukprot:753461-Hanusia_phi.AAC.1
MDGYIFAMFVPGVGVGTRRGWWGTTFCQKGGVLWLDSHQGVRVGPMEGGFMCHTWSACKRCEHAKEGGGGARMGGEDARREEGKEGEELQRRGVKSCCGYAERSELEDDKISCFEKSLPVQGSVEGPEGIR